MPSQARSRVVNGSSYPPSPTVNSRGVADSGGELMTNMHYDEPHEHTEIVETGTPFLSPFVIALVTLLILALLAFALLWSRPWGSGSSHTNDTPGISDNGGGGGGGDNSGSGTGGGSQPNY